MTTRLPHIGGDNGDWGEVLNSFLQVAHNSDGTLQPNSVAAAGAYSKPVSGIPATDLASTIQTALTSATTALQPGTNGLTDWLNVKHYGATGDGSTDDTIAIQAALDAAATAGGGVVYLPAATYVVSNITLDTNVTLCGAGWATILQAKAGTSGYLIAVTHLSTSRQVTIRDLALSTPYGGATAGHILLDNTGWAGGDPFDCMHRVLNVFSFNAGGDAFHFGANTRGLVVVGCSQYQATGVGFYFEGGCTDSFISHCNSGPSGGHGFYIAGWNNMLMSCKSFWAGYDNATHIWDVTKNGFELTGRNNTLEVCQAQQSSNHGFNLNGCQYTNVSGCECDSNSTGSTTGAAVNIADASYCTVANNVGIAGNGGSAGPGPGQQVYGVQTSGTCTGTAITGNTVSGTSGPYNLVGSSYIFSPIEGVVTAIQSGGNVTADASLGSVFRVALTASGWTIATPLNPIDGHTISYEISQDNTGGRTFAWAAAFAFGSAGEPTLPTTASDMSRVTFSYNASLGKWMFLSAVTGYGAGLPPTTTVTVSVGSGQVAAMSVMAFTGAAPIQNGQTGSIDGGSAGQGLATTITPSATGSYIVGVNQIFPGSTDPTPTSNITVLSAGSGDGGCSYQTFITSAKTTSGSPVTVGATAEQGQFNGVAAAEILAGGTLSYLVSGTNVNQQQATDNITANINHGTLLVVLAVCPGGVPTVSDSAGLTWTPLATAKSGDIGVWAAYIA
ncbi:MAG TPA: glycosyl hydrolase family 28-related protein [Candidatus Saccharimonadales bacterium]|nr:glycosyl hydrolase family 28-related protein [Candidatus Saccharimonadales bacterium]